MGIKKIIENDYVEINQVTEGKQIFVREKYSGVVIIPCDNQGNILLLRHMRAVEKNPMLELPRGIMEAGETVVQGAARELFEETNLKAAESDFIELGKIHPDSGFLNDDTTIVMVNVKKFENVKANDKSEKIVGHIVVTKDELRKLIHDKKICDGFTLSAFGMLLATD